MTLLHPLYVCDRCSQHRHCTLTHRTYDPWDADLKARKLLTAICSGVQCTPEEITRMDKILTDEFNKKHIDIFDELDMVLGPENFVKLFPVILTDNGSEFSDPQAIEKRHFTGFYKEMYDETHGTDYGQNRTKIFYCDPRALQQKGAIEVNHEFIRRIIPKRELFKTLTQEKVNLMMNHINSYPRKKLGDRSPYDCFRFFYGQKILDILGYKRVDPKDVNLTPQLLK